MVVVVSFNFTPFYCRGSYLPYCRCVGTPPWFYCEWFPFTPLMFIDDQLFPPLVVTCLCLFTLLVLLFVLGVPLCALHIAVLLSISPCEVNKLTSYMYMCIWSYGVSSQCSSPPPHDCIVGSLHPPPPQETFTCGICIYI